jgi:putative two-component system response regulator
VTAVPFPSLGIAEKPRVLVVDDEPNIRMVLLRALSQGGYELREASSAEAALQLYHQYGADVILSDLQMPGMSGIDLLRRTKEMDDAVGFVILTGAGTMQDTIEALRLQADEYLLKPFNLEEVSIAVDRALRHRRLVLENRFYQNHLEARVAEQAEQLENMFVEALLSLANAIEARDGYTRGHVERVTAYAVSTGAQMQLSPDQLRTLWVGALLHDVGKIGVPDQILKKPGKLTIEEYEVMKRHPSIGAAIMERSSFLRPALLGVLHHQERWDGSGYPFGLRGEDIALEGRILSVADTYDAIVTTRPYRGMRSSEAAVAELRRCAGTQFDPNVVVAFVEALELGFPQDPSVPRLPSREPVVAVEFVSSAS